MGVGGLGLQLPVRRRGRGKEQGIQNPNPMSKMQNKDHRPGADVGLGDGVFVRMHRVIPREPVMVV